MSRIAAGSAIPRVSGSVSRFSLLVVHVSSGFLEEGVERSGWFDAHGFPEFGVGEEPPPHQVSLHIVRARDLDGFPVEAVDELLRSHLVSGRWPRAPLQSSDVIEAQ